MEDEYPAGIEVQVYVRLVLGSEVKEILSIAPPGEVPPELSFCQVKIKRRVVPAKVFGRATVA